MRTFKYALTAVLGAALVVPALAQDNFPDVPDNHWAYEALLRMKSNGLLVGYPDGLFRGGRPASRYEMAVAIHATYVNLKNITDGLQKQIDELKAQMGTGNGGDTESLRKALEALQAEVAGMKKWGDDVAALRRLVDTFQKELQDLGVNVEQVKKDLSDLTARVEALEKNKPTVTISGDANIWVGSGAGRSGFGNLDKDGRFGGARLNNGQVVETSFLKDLTVLHEGAITLTTTNETGPKFSGTLVAGNMLGVGPGPRAAFGNQSTQLPGFGYYESNQSDFYIQNFAVHFDSKLAGLGVDAKIGRVGYSISPYIYQRPDFTSYFYNDRWDNGQWLHDGAILGFNFGRVGVDVFGGKVSRRFSTNGIDLQPQGAGTMLQVDKVLGAKVGIGLGDTGMVNVAYLIQDSDNVGFFGNTNFNRVTTFGADANLKFGGLKVMGGYAQTDLQRNNKNRNTSDNKQWNVGLGYGGEKWGITAEYREIDPFYFASGDWGRLGIWRNPTNIKGVRANGFFKIGDALTLKAGGEFDKGKKNVAGSPLNTSTEINSFNVGLDYMLSPNFTVMVSYEDTTFKNLALQGFAGVKPRYRWTSIGALYNISDSTSLRLGYEFSDITNEFALPILNPGSPVSQNGTYKGGLFTTQLSVKF